MDRVAKVILDGPLTLCVIILCLFQMSLWVPHFLTWPFSIDHDVFATLALGWDSGALPYRDLRSSNFPGTIYLFWILGKFCGWGRTAPAFALDALLLTLLGIALLLWSRRTTGQFLPGAVACASFVSYYLGLDHSLVFQRDWHGPLFMVLALLLVDGVPTRTGRMLSAACVAVAFAIRPQVVLLIPAVAFRVVSDAGGRPLPRREAFRLLAAWSSAAAALIILAFSPIIAGGIWPDFLRGVGLTAYGRPYNEVTVARIARQFFLQALHPQNSLIPLALILFGSHPDSGTRAAKQASLIAIGGAWLYKPLSPVPWPYLAHPLALVLSMSMVPLVHLVSRAVDRPSARLGVLLLCLLGFGVTLKPPYCSLGESFRSLEDLRAGRIPEGPPLGSLMRDCDRCQEPYDWRDYRGVLLYLRQKTSRGSHVANLLRKAPALTGPTGRLTALPAESLAWLVVEPGDDANFSRALEDAGDSSVVVWAPSEEDQDGGCRLAPAVRSLAPVVRRYYQPETRFGPIEIWRRKK